MATLNIRNVPADVVDALKARAQLKGVSLNTEVVQTLTRVARKRSLDEVFASIDRIQEQLPPLLDFDEMLERMRQERDERDARILRAALRRPGEG